MPNQPKQRASSASRQKRKDQRRSSLDARDTEFNPQSRIYCSQAVLGGVDLRTPKQKIEDLENEIIELKDEAISEQYFNQIVLLQVYKSLEYGENSVENAQAYVSLSKYYLNRSALYLPQAKSHALTARKILEKLAIKPNDHNLEENLLAYDIYFILLQCSLKAKKCLLDRNSKLKTKNISVMDTTHIEHDFSLMEKYLNKLKNLMKPNKYEKLYIEYLWIKFDKIIIDSVEFDESIYELVDEIIISIDKHKSNDQIKHKIDLYLRAGSYLMKFNDDIIQLAIQYYRKAYELANEEHRKDPSTKNKNQCANTILQFCIAKLKSDRFTDDLENELQQAISLYKDQNEEMNKNALKVIDELATFYTKMQQYQDALNVLCESLPDKIQIFGDFSEEVIQTESRIGAIYLKEGECLNAAEHLQNCLELQEFVYGPSDSRTCETRKTVEMLKKDPMVSRTFFARTLRGQNQDRPEFRVKNKVSHDEEDLQLIRSVTKKPPITSKT